MNQIKLISESSCLELALEGERLCREGDCHLGIQYLETAVEAGTNDLKTLGAIFLQLGNAFYVLQNYNKSLEYHTKHLDLSRKIGDREEEVRASGNIGNTLKALGKFEESITCCHRQLDTARDIQDKAGEAKALYNLGNVFHAKGKQIGKSDQKDPGEYPIEAQEALETAISYYEVNLALVRELKDKTSLGKTCGNIGNTHYLLGNFNQAVQFHEERLAIAKEFGDKSAERRAYNNLGNAYMFMGDFHTATNLYLKSLETAQLLNDIYLEAQACYSIGNTYTLLREHLKAIEYYIRHLRLARELRDKLGEGRACWSLANVYTVLGKGQEALPYARLHMDISKEVGDEKGISMAEVNLHKIRELVANPSLVDDSGFKRASSCRVKLSDNREEDTWSNGSRSRRRSMENLELVQLTPDKQSISDYYKSDSTSSSSWKRQFKTDKVFATPRTVGEKKKKVKSSKKQSSVDSEEDNFFELLSKFQSRRIDDQRCSSSVLSTRLFTSDPPESTVNKTKSKGSDYDIGKYDRESISSSFYGNEEDEENHLQKKLGARGENGSVNRSSGIEDDFLDMLAGIQGSRMNDQRAEFSWSKTNASKVIILPSSLSIGNSNRDPHKSINDIDSHVSVSSSKVIPSTSRSVSVGGGIRGGNIGPNKNSANVVSSSSPSVSDDQFFEMLMRCQGARLNNQRSELPSPPPGPSTVPDEDFLNLIQRFQCSRIEEQRSWLPNQSNCSNLKQNNTNNCSKSKCANEKITNKPEEQCIDNSKIKTINKLSASDDNNQFSNKSKDSKYNLSTMNKLKEPYDISNYNFSTRNENKLVCSVNQQDLIDQPTKYIQERNRLPNSYFNSVNIKTSEKCNPHS